MALNPTETIDIKESCYRYKVVYDIDFVEIGLNKYPFATVLYCVM